VSRPSRHGRCNSNEQSLLPSDADEAFGASEKLNDSELASLADSARSDADMRCPAELETTRSVVGQEMEMLCTVRRWITQEVLGSKDDTQPKGIYANSDITGENVYCSSLH
jgi:hypothetical protein